MASLGGLSVIMTHYEFTRTGIEKVHVLLLGRPRYFRGHMNQFVHLMAAGGR